MTITSFFFVYVPTFSNGERESARKQGGTGDIHTINMHTHPDHSLKGTTED